VPIPTVWDQLILLVVFPVAELLVAPKVIGTPEAGGGGGDPPSVMVTTLLPRDS
jgi:hypothetical protein